MGVFDALSNMANRAIENQERKTKSLAKDAIRKIDNIEKAGKTLSPEQKMKLEQGKENAKRYL